VSYKSHFSRALAADPSRLHFAAHSHHLWPDASHEGQMRAWDDAARLADRKWDHIFEDVYPRAQRHVARILGLPRADTVAFAPNTHDFVVRILSALPLGRPLRILTTDSEFHSFRRQVDRLEEDGLVEVTRIPCEPFETFGARFGAAAATAAGPWDLVFLSHVFFRSGWVVRDLEALIGQVPRETPVVVDGYHGFCAVETRFASLADRAFYVAGGYKYAMSGEGVCFLHAPPGQLPRPRATGWYASFGALAGRASGVPYSEDGSRFLGSTFDPSGLYRFTAVMDWLVGLGVGAAQVRAHTRPLAEAFVDAVDAAALPFSSRNLVVPAKSPDRGQFLTFELPEAKAVHDALLRANVVTDVRENRLRFGFGLYHDLSDIHAGVPRIQAALR
jgi:selenocysteine lyase/cysteine desulfurase